MGFRPRHVHSRISERSFRRGENIASGRPFSGLRPTAAEKSSKSSGQCATASAAQVDNAALRSFGEPSANVLAKSPNRSAHRSFDTRTECGHPAMIRSTRRRLPPHR
jgi:uncharacterized protein with von Willebrand factor type A (vWA) domain